MNLLRNLIVLVACTLTCMHGVKAQMSNGLDEEEKEGLFTPIKNAYDKLPETGKLGTGAVAGFVASKMAVGSAQKALKTAGAVYVLSEVLSFTGVLDNVKPTDDAKSMMEAAKSRALNTVEKYKEEVRRRLGPKGIKGTIQAAATKEKMFTFGVAGGSLVAFVL